MSGISDYITQRSDEELEKFRAIEGPDLPFNLAQRFPSLRPPLFYYGLEIPGILYSDFVDKIDFWSKEVGSCPTVVQAYGCANGSGWIIDFGNTNYPRQVPDEIINYYEQQLQIGPAKWYLSFEYPRWRWI